MSDAREKLVGILRLSTEQLEKDVAEANRQLLYIGRDSEITSRLRNSISASILEGVKEGVKKANASGMSVKVDAVNKTTGGTKGSSSDDKAVREYTTELSKQIKLIREISQYDAQILTADNNKKASLTEIVNRKRQELEAQRQIVTNAAAQLTSEKGIAATKAGSEKITKAEQDAKDKVAVATAKAADAEEKRLAKLEAGGKALKVQTTLLDKVVTSLTHMAMSAVMQAVTQTLRDAVQYATQFYDKMNEIRIVTGKTQSEADGLGVTFRQIASDMSVSSKEVADAAIIFYRQGLGDTEVNQRLEATIQYAKTAGVEAENAANKITSVVNSISKDARGVEMTAQRVADVFLYLGDNAASSGEEIGTAMSRSAALADTAGVSFEMLGAMIATVSERTRQDAGTIGTALNAIMSRLTSVKQKGFNEEDETKVNDVAKALSRVNVQLTDGQGQWRRIEDIFMDVAKVWDTLDDKTQNYLATVMAGVRQQNVFRNLMADMSQVTEGNSRVMELYEGALNSAGTAAEKYSVYAESVTAAHDRMAASMEKLYSLFDANIMKGIYNAGSSIAEGIYSLFGGEDTHSYASAIATMTEQQNTIQMTIEKYSKLKEELDKLTVGSAEYNAKAKEMDGVVQSLANQYAPFAEKVEQAGEKFSSADEAIKAMNDALREQIELIRGYRGLDIGSQIVSAVDAYEEAVERLNLSNQSSGIRNLFTSLVGASGYDIQLITEDEVKDVIHQIRETIGQLNVREVYANGGDLRTDKDSPFMTMLIDYIYGDDGQADVVARQALYSFMQGFQDDYVKAWQTFRADTTYPAQQAVEATQKDVLDTFISYAHNSEFYDSLSTEMRKVFDGALDKAFSGINWDRDIASQGYNAVESVIKVFTDNKDAMQKALQNVFDYQNADVFDVNNPEHAKALHGFIEEYEKYFELVFGRKLTGDEWVQLLAPTLNKTKTATEEAQDQLESFYEYLSKARAAAAYDNKKEGGFLAEMNALQKMADEGKYEQILNVFNTIRSDKDSTMWDDITKRYTWLTTVLDEFAKGHYENGMKLLAEGMEEVGKKSKDLTDAEKAIQKVNEAAAKSYMLSTAKADKYETQKNEILGLKGEDGSFDKSKLESYFGELSEKGLLSGLYSQFEGLEDAYGLFQADVVAGSAAIIAILTNEENAWEKYHQTVQKTLSSIRNNEAYQKSKGDNFLPERTQIENLYQQNDYAGILSFIDRTDKMSGGKFLSDLTSQFEGTADAIQALEDGNPVMFFNLWSKAMDDFANKEQAEKIKKLREEIEKLGPAMRAEEFKKNGGFRDIAKGMLAYGFNEDGSMNIDEIMDWMTSLQDMGLYSDFASAYPNLMAAIGDYMTEDGQTEQNLQAVKNALADAADAWTTYAIAKKKAQEETIDDDEGRQIAGKLAKAQNVDELRSIFESDQLTEAEKTWAQNNIDIIDQLMLGKIPTMEAWNQLRQMALGTLDLSQELANKTSDSAFEELKSSGFASWLDEIKSMMDSEDGGSLYAWLLGKDESQRSAFFEMYPMFNELWEKLVSNEGNVGWIANFWQQFKDAMYDAKSEYEEFWEEINKSETPDNARGQELLMQLSSAMSEGGIEKYKETFNGFTDAEQKWIAQNSDTAKQLGKTEDGAVDAAKAVEGFADELRTLERIDLQDHGKIWSKTSDYIDDATQGGDAYYDTVAKLIDEVDKFTAAQTALNAIQSGQLTPNTDAYNEALQTLSSYTGIASAYMIDNLDLAAQMLSGDMELAGNSVGYLAQWLLNTANIQFDSTNWRMQLAMLAEQGTETQKRMAELVLTMLDLDGSQLVAGPDGSITVDWGGRNYQQKPTRDRTGSGSGSGSSSSSSSSNRDNKKTISEIQRLVDLMDQVTDLFKYHQSMIQQIQSIYSGKGEYTNLIHVYEEEIAALKERQTVLQDNIEKIEPLLEAQQELVAGMSTSDENYQQESEDLKRLQEAHQKYMKELLENVEALDELEQKIKEARDAIRQLEIDLENEILQAIKDREAKQKRMLEGRIEMENTILDLIKRRYEIERDEILDATNQRIASLEKESDELEKQLNLRKKMADQEDKQTKLQQLQEKLIRISADPTRQKEAQALQKEIAQLREEMAWEAAEEEVKAQQDAIDQQVNSLEDYVDYVEQYYEDLFDHPQKLIAEMKEVIAGTDEEIMAWLAANSEEYANATEATQEKMRTDWQETLNDMRGITETHWEEVYDIISQGDEAIIAFLTENRDDFISGSIHQQEQYLDKWKELCDNIKKAYADTYEAIQKYDYSTIPTPDPQSYTGGSSSSSSSSGSGGGGGTNPQPQQKKKYYIQVERYGKKTSLEGIYGTFSTESAAKTKIARLRADGVYETDDNLSVQYHYKKGGLVNYTGPAWVDGSPNEPEAFLSAKQTQVIGDFAKLLERIVAPTFPSSLGYEMNGGDDNRVTIETINVNVEKLDSDADYEEIAARVGEVLVRSISRTSSVGGIRM